VAGNILPQNILRLSENVPKNSIQKRPAVGYGNNAERCDLPDITMVQFRHSDVEPGSQTVPDLAQDCTLLLE
jgi:hypothetical protein